MRGVPLRIELGARDLEAGVATLVRRDRAFKEEGQKRTVPLVAWCGGPECEAAVKDATSATSRNLRRPARSRRAALRAASRPPPGLLCAKLLARRARRRVSLAAALCAGSRARRSTRRVVRAAPAATVATARGSRSALLGAAAAGAAAARALRARRRARRLRAWLVEGTKFHRRSTRRLSDARSTG
jgi:hypothetical protein